MIEQDLNTMRNIDTQFKRVNKYCFFRNRESLVEILRCKLSKVPLGLFHFSGCTVGFAMLFENRNGLGLFTSRPTHSFALFVNQ
jgi:hypothetical protein